MNTLKEKKKVLLLIGLDFTKTTNENARPKERNDI